MELLGITPTIWQQMRTPKAHSGGELGLHTQVYVDFHIALELLHIPYSEYIRRVPLAEREANQLYLSLKNLKEEDAMRRSQEQAEMERAMTRNMPNGYRA